VNVTVLGAGGRTGRGVVAEALVRRHEVTAVVRRPPDPPLDPAARTVTGDARDAAALAQALEGADAVLSAMGPAGEDPGTVYSEAVAALVAAMEASGPARLVITANSWVFGDDPLTGPYAGVSREHRRALARLRASRLDWTVVATPMLTDDAPAAGYSAIVDATEGGTIDRVDFARAVVDALDHDEWIGHAVEVTN
jgi:putative NADH-flavin reductase